MPHFNAAGEEEWVCQKGAHVCTGESIWVRGVGNVCKACHEKEEKEKKKLHPLSLSTPDCVRLICHLAEVHGDVTHSTISKDFDPTSRTLYEVDVAMEAIKIEPASEDLPCEEHYPVKEIYHVEVDCIWDTEIRIDGPDGKRLAENYWTEKGWSRKNPEVIEDLLYKLLLNGIWHNPGKPPLFEWEKEEDPMGPLSRYE